MRKIAPQESRKIISQITQVEKKTLGQVSRILRTVSLVPDKSVNRVPVYSVQLGECLLRTRSLTLSRK